MKKILFFVLVSFAFCSCRQTVNSTRAMPQRQMIFLSPVTFIEMMKEAADKTTKMAEVEQMKTDVDTRCSIYDNECQKRFFQDIAVNYAPTGIPELGIPVLDPFALTNVTLSILGLVELTLIEGVAEGIGKCVVTKFVTNVDARYREPSIMCNQIVIKGRYKLTSVMADVCDWCNVHGEGNLNIVLENWFFRIRYPFRIIRRSDGEIYLDALFDEAFYETTVDKVTLTADSVFIGKHEITKHVVFFINKFWKIIMRSDVGKDIYDKSVEYYYDIYGIFFDKSPANTFLKDDLTPLIDN